MNRDPLAANTAAPDQTGGASLRLRVKILTAIALKPHPAPRGKPRRAVGA
jgi:hypothetical protein